MKRNKFMMEDAAFLALECVVKTESRKRIKRRRLVALDGRRVVNGREGLAHRMAAVALKLIAMATGARFIAGVIHVSLGVPAFGKRCSLDLTHVKKEC